MGVANILSTSICAMPRVRGSWGYTNRRENPWNDPRLRKAKEEREARWKVRAEQARALRKEERAAAKVAKLAAKEAKVRLV